MLFYNQYAYILANILILSVLFYIYVDGNKYFDLILKALKGFFIKLHCNIRRPGLYDNFTSMHKESFCIIKQKIKQLCE